MRYHYYIVLTALKCIAPIDLRCCAWGQYCRLSMSTSLKTIRQWTGNLCSIVFVKTHTIPLSAVSIGFQIKQNDHKDATCWLWIWLQNVQYRQTLDTTAWHDTRMNKNNQTECTIFAPALRTEILGMTTYSLRILTYWCREIHLPVKWTQLLWYTVSSHPFLCSNIKRCVSYKMLPLKL